MPAACDASTSPVPSPSPTPQGETQPCDGVPARLTGRHFLGKRETDSDCKVCSQHKRKRVEEEEQEENRKKKRMEEDEEPERETEDEAKGVNSHDERTEEERCEKDCEHKSEALRRQTSYYCKTCSGEPSLCPVPCFELYHTRLIYKTPPPELETQGEPSK